MATSAVGWKAVNARRLRLALFGAIAAAACLACLWPTSRSHCQSPDPRPPKHAVKLVFVHHSCGENWLADSGGGLGRRLATSGYFVSDTNYGWGPDGIGDLTDITDWPNWFTGRRSGSYLQALFRESRQHCEYSRPLRDPGGENQIVMFKSCFPNSNLEGRPSDPPRRGSGLTVSNAKAIYNELLAYFGSRPDKLFIVVAAPPVQDPALAANARALNRWLVEDWLAGYPGRNVAVFDFYNVLTGPHNHHRLAGGKIEHVFEAGHDTLYYPSGGDDHPSSAGNRKATDEFVPLLNVWYNRWAASAPSAAPPSGGEIRAEAGTTNGEFVVPPSGGKRPAEAGTTSMAAGESIDDFEVDAGRWAAFLDASTGTRLTFARDRQTRHSQAASLAISHDVSPGSWATCSLVFDQPQDWSGFQGISLWLCVEKMDRPAAIVVYGGSPDDLIHFETRLTADRAAAGGWQQIVVRWPELKPPAWQDDGTHQFDPARILGIAFALEASEDARNTGRFWVDDIRLVSQ